MTDIKGAIMKSYIVRWDAGFGMEYEEVEAENEDKARMLAYKLWKDDAENNADWGVIGEATEELREEYL